MIRLTLGLAGALMLASCATPTDVREAPATATMADPYSLTASSWRIASGPISLDPSDVVVLEFRADNTFGVAGLCNRMGGNYTADAGAVRFNSVLSTRMACQEERRMRVEAEVGGALQKPATARIAAGSPNTLYLSFDQGINWVLKAQP